MAESNAMVRPRATAIEAASTTEQARTRQKAVALLRTARAVRWTTADGPVPNQVPSPIVTASKVAGAVTAKCRLVIELVARATVPKVDMSGCGRFAERDAAVHQPTGMLLVVAPKRPRHNTRL